MPITRTNTKRYVAHCGIGECAWMSVVDSRRLLVAQRLRAHQHQQHTEEERKAHNMKSPGKGEELPEQDGGEKLSEYAGHLVVFNKGWTGPADRDTKFGARPAIVADMWAYVDGEWKGLGDVPVFFSTVQKQLINAGSDEPYGGVLVQGSDRNPREWHIEAPKTKEQAKLLNEWTDSF